MSGTITRTPCPKCGMTGDLYIAIELVAKPVGAFSLAGAQTKFSGKVLPVLRCGDCGFMLVGEFDGDSHAVFRPPTTEVPEGAS